MIADAPGYDSVEQVLAKLKSAIADYELVKNAEVVEQKCRIEREVLRREQEREYEFSKAQDRARREELQRQKQKQEYAFCLKCFIHLWRARIINGHAVMTATRNRIKICDF
ncbi:hypothetical protein Tcan_10847 [Toxocara canis]|uniref:Uncharacterized protein n=1 Tax=Toxocara canis TaxID=6265 RepID=A0A0B2VN25_TOXCA|nr:hypothetical protein Tcan_10847 [Toxocara canis]